MRTFLVINLMAEQKKGLETLLIIHGSYLQEEAKLLGKRLNRSLEFTE
jgi:hypothetical protein